MNKNTKNMFVWFILGLVVVVAIYQLINRGDLVIQLATSDFHNYIDPNYVKDKGNRFDGHLILDDEWIEGKFHENYLMEIRIELESPNMVVPEKWAGEFKASRDTNDDYGIQERLDNVGIPYNAKPASNFPNWLLVFGTTIVPLLIFLGLMIFLSRQMQGSGNRALSFGKSRATLHTENEKLPKFEDVAGVDEAKEALEEIIEFLKAPKKFERLGGTIPTGVLLVGPPRYG